MENQQLCVDVESTMKVTELCIQTNIFQYDGKLYQVKGVLMGSIVFVVLVELIMQNIEKTILRNRNYTVTSMLGNSALNMFRRLEMADLI